MVKYNKNGTIKSMGAQFTNPKITEKDLVEFEDGNKIVIFYQVDKNGSICDCSRYGNALDKLHGRPASLVDAFEIIINELKKDYNG